MNYTMLDPNDRNHKCSVCGGTKSVKYTASLADDDLFFCNLPECFLSMMTLNNALELMKSIDDKDNSPKTMQDINKVLGMLTEVTEIISRYKK